MTLIAQANIIDKTNHHNLFRQRTSSTKDDLKTLSLNVYSSQHSISTAKQTRHQQYPLHIILPSIDKDENRYQRKTKRPSYRTSIYHSIVSNVTPVDLPQINTVHRKKPDVLTLVREDTFMYIKPQHAPPPTPSDDQLEQLLDDLNRTRQSTPQLSTNGDDGFVPYRLPVLNRSKKEMRKAKLLPLKHPKTILSNYYQRLYSKY